jgi:hypothetical protein
MPKEDYPEVTPAIFVKNNPSLSNLLISSGILKKRHLAFPNSRVDMDMLEFTLK